MKGFTLIEICIVMCIILVLFTVTTVSVPRVMGILTVQQSARSVRKILDFGIHYGRLLSQPVLLEKKGDRLVVRTSAPGWARLNSFTGNPGPQTIAALDLEPGIQVAFPGENPLLPLTGSAGAAAALTVKYKNWQQVVGIDRLRGELAIE